MTLKFVKVVLVCLVVAVLMSMGINQAVTGLLGVGLAQSILSVLISGYLGWQMGGLTAHEIVASLEKDSK